MKRWQILASYLCGVIAIGCGFFAGYGYGTHRPQLILMIVAGMTPLLLCMMFAQEDGMRPTHGGEL